MNQIQITEKALTTQRIICIAYDMYYENIVSRILNRSHRTMPSVAIKRKKTRTGLTNVFKVKDKVKVI